MHQIYPPDITDSSWQIKGYTEYQSGVSNQIFRSHPSFKSQGFWYDWVLIRTSSLLSVDKKNKEPSEAVTEATVPCRLAAIISAPYSEDEKNAPISDHLKLIVQPCTSRTYVDSTTSFSGMEVQFNGISFNLSS